VASHATHYLIDALKYPEAITPTVAPERFCDHEVIVKALVHAYVMSRTRIHSLSGLCRSAPYRLVYSMRRATIVFRFVKASR
jgi:hypothetical protein